MAETEDSAAPAATPVTALVITTTIALAALVFSALSGTENGLKLIDRIRGGGRRPPRPPEDEGEGEGQPPRCPKPECRKPMTFVSETPAPYWQCVGIPPHKVHVEE